MKNCPTERKLGEKIVLLNVIAAKKNCPTGRNSTKKIVIFCKFFALQRRREGLRLYESLVGARKIFLYNFKLS